MYLELRVLTVVQYFIFDSHWNGLIGEINEENVQGYLQN